MIYTNAVMNERIVLPVHLTVGLFYGIVLNEFKFLKKFIFESLPVKVHEARWMMHG